MILQETTKKLENSKLIYEKDNKSNKKVVWQEKMKPLEVEVREQYVTGSKKYLVKITLKEVRPKIL